MTLALTTISRYRREDVLRILQLQSRQLQKWERSGLVAEQDSYSFQDLVELRKLRDLSSKQMNLAKIRDTVEAMRRVAGMQSPLREADAVRKGSRLVFRHDGAIEDPFSPQLMFDFECLAQQMPAIAPQQSDSASRLQEMFLQAVQLEEAGALQPDLLLKAGALYRKILEANPQHAPACINLGTLHYNQGHFKRPKRSIAARPMPTANMRSRFLIWAMCSTNCTVCPRRSWPTSVRLSWCLITPMRITTWRWPMSGRESDGARCGTGWRTRGWTRWDRGRAMRAARRKKSSARSGWRLFTAAIGRCAAWPDKLRQKFYRGAIFNAGR